MLRQIVVPLVLATLVAGLVVSLLALIWVPGAATFVALWAGAAVVGVMGVGVVIARRVSEPLERLSAGTRLVAEGDFSAKVEVTGPPEMAELALTFNEMTESLRERTDALTKKMLELGTLYEMSRAVGGTFDLAELLGSVVESGLRIFSVELGYAAVRDRETGALRILGLHGVPDADPELLVASPAAWVVREGRPLICNAEPAEQFAAIDPVTGAASALCVPLRNGDEIIGALTIGTKDESYRFDGDDVRLLSTIANQVTMAVGNIELFSSLQEAYLATVRSLAAAIDAKDAYTRGHSDRVAAYAVAIAERLGLPAEQRMALEMAAYLHDIGKIGVPEHILRKPGRLDDDEMAQMRHHPLIGAGILKPVAFPWPITPIVRHHHEAWDGSGYPAGLVGADIPPLARILTVADSYEAMVSDRPYRKGLDPHDAINELRRCCATQFDPDVVELFAEIISEAVFDGSLPVTGSIEEISDTEAAEACSALHAGVLESFRRLGGDQLADKVEAEAAASPASGAGDRTAMRATLRGLDRAIAHLSGSALVDHFYAEAMASMPPRLRAVAEELDLLPGSGPAAVA